MSVDFLLERELSQSDANMFGCSVLVVLFFFSPPFIDFNNYLALGSVNPMSSTLVCSDLKLLWPDGIKEGCEN